jgi:hypothetical protein
MDLKSYKQVLSIEETIVESGRLTLESLVSICEYRPWMFKAMAEYLGLSPSELKDFAATHIISGWAYFYVLTKSRMQVEPRVGLFSAEVIYE